MLAAGGEYKQLAENRLWKDENAGGGGQRPGRGMFGGRTQYAAVAISGGLLVRTGDVLYCLRK